MRASRSKAPPCACAISIAGARPSSRATRAGASIAAGSRRSSTRWWSRKRATNRSKTRSSSWPAPTAVFDFKLAKAAPEARKTSQAASPRSTRATTPRRRRRSRRRWRRRPACPRLRVNLALAYLRLGRNADAVAQLEQGDGAWSGRSERAVPAWQRLCRDASARQSGHRVRSRARQAARPQRSAGVRGDRRPSAPSTSPQGKTTRPRRASSRRWRPRRAPPRRRSAWPRCISARAKWTRRSRCSTASSRSIQDARGRTSRDLHQGTPQGRI